MEKHKIAIIEDDKVLSKTLSEELNEAGFAVVQAFDGKSGFELVESEKPDLVLLDIVMPGMDGMQVFEKIRENSWGKNMPVIFLTQFDTDDERLKKVVKYEPAYYLIKSKLKVRDVVDKVKERLGAGSK